MSVARGSGELPGSFPRRFQGVSGASRTALELSQKRRLWHLSPPECSPSLSKACVLTSGALPNPV